MEVLAQSNLRYAEKSDCAGKNSVRDYIYGEEGNCVPLTVEAQPRTDKLDMKHTENKLESDGQEQLPNCISDCNLNGSSQSESNLQGQKIPGDLNDTIDVSLEGQDPSKDPCIPVDSSNPILDAIKDKNSLFSVAKCPDDSDSLALWVKWKGRWQAGIKCERADWPLATIREKPTHDRKNYIVMFFPHTRNYSWADTLLVCSIHEVPEPIVHRSHNVGRELVKDLTMARRFIMQKLAAGMLNIMEQLSVQVMIETARHVVVWKDFAKEASQSKDYSDIGRMLVKLRNMLLQQYLNPEWLQNSSNSWVERCQSALSADSVEVLKEELVGSILWKEVNSQKNVDEQQTEISLQWKTWKHEAMTWLSALNPPSGAEDSDHDGLAVEEQQNNSCSLPTCLQNGRKRPKLEVRRAEPHASVMEYENPIDAAIEIDSDFFIGRSTVTVDSTREEESRKEDSEKDDVEMGSPGCIADKLDDIADTSNTYSIQSKYSTPLSPASDRKAVNSRHRGRKCIAFIEAKGRQCVRWANDGDEYCCVHLSARFQQSTVKAEKPPTGEVSMCQGITTIGNGCKHRALHGSSYCKKHRLRDHVMKTTSSPVNQLKRKHDELANASPISCCKDIVVAEEVPTALDVEPIAVMEEDVNSRERSLVSISENSTGVSSLVPRQCIGLGMHEGGVGCLESPKRHSLYCEKHVPSWLKRARNGKSRIISKEVFIDLLHSCSSWTEKLQLHQACELFYKLFKSILSLRNPAPREVQFKWALSEASKDSHVAECLMNLVSREKDRLRRIWGFSVDGDGQVSSHAIGKQDNVPMEEDSEDDGTIKCKLCSEEFADEQSLGTHWIDSHSKEAQWLFRGYACAICLDSFTNRKVLEAHVQDRHHAQFVEHCMLIQCIPCGCHFGNSNELWTHVLSTHADGFRKSKGGEQLKLPSSEDPQPKPDTASTSQVENHAEGHSGARKFTCRFCKLRFNLLPDLGRHHQAAHMGPSLLNSSSSKKGLRFYAYRLKSGRLSRPKLKKMLGGSSLRLKNKVAAGLKKRIQASSSLGEEGTNVQPHSSEAASLDILTEDQCLAIAKILSSEAQKTRVNPSNHDILSVARSSCCKVSLQDSLEEKFGILPERIYLKAAKLCSERNTRVSWHQDGFVCANGCKASNVAIMQTLPIVPSIEYPQSEPCFDPLNNEYEMDECHYVIDFRHFRSKPLQTTIILCEDISFGRESVPIACVIEKGFMGSLHLPTLDIDGEIIFMPWESFTYVTKSLLHKSLDNSIQGLQLGCGCEQSSCCAETCDHLYLFNSDCEDAKDIYGQPMRGRFSYDTNGRILLQDGYPLYECNELCPCSIACPNRILQKGVQVKLEVFKTEEKGWAVRAGQAISRGSFVCEFMGEILDENEANRRRKRYGKDGCNYFYDIGAHIRKTPSLAGEEAPYVIDATKYGNISRFINYSCSPNLAIYIVLVESMDFQLAHVGLYASQDIAVGEELNYEYQFERRPGDGLACLCGAASCRGRLH